MKFDQIRSDVELQEKGEWHEHPYFDGIQILVRSPSCDAVEKRRTQLLNRLPRKVRKTGEITEDTRRIELQCTAECLIDVAGIDDVTYSVDIGRQWAKDRGMRRFLEGVREVADLIGEVEAEAHEEAVSD